MAIVPLLVGASRRERPNVRPPNVVGIALLAVPIIVGLVITLNSDNPLPVVAGLLVGLVLMQSPKIAQQWERAIVLRLGRFTAMRGPGLGLTSMRERLKVVGGQLFIHSQRGRGTVIHAVVPRCLPGSMQMKFAENRH